MYVVAPKMVLLVLCYEAFYPFSKFGSVVNQKKKKRLPLLLTHWFFVLVRCQEYCFTVVLCKNSAKYGEGMFHHNFFFELLRICKIDHPNIRMLHAKNVQITSDASCSMKESNKGKKKHNSLNPIYIETHATKSRQPWPFGFCQKSQGVKLFKNYRECPIQAIIVRSQLQFVSTLG